MERGFTDGSSYGYEYESPQYFYQPASPAYQPGYSMQQGDSMHGQQYAAWEPQHSWQGYGQQPHMYNNGSYAQQGFNYEYYGNFAAGDQGYNAGYDMTYVPQDYNGSQAQDIQSRVSSQSSRSKHSYSQNRNRNRQRPDAYQNTQVDIAGNDLSSSNSNTNNNSDWSIDLVEDSNKITVTQEPSGSYNKDNGNVKIQNKENSSANTTFDRGKNRGSRFQGTDSRSKPFNRAQQFDERQRGYNKNFTSSDSSAPKVSDGVKNSAELNKDKVSDGATNQSEESNNNKNSKGAKTKSYKDSRAERVASSRSDKFSRSRNDRDWRQNRDEEKDDKSKRISGPRDKVDDKSIRNNETNEKSKNETQPNASTETKTKDVNDESYDSGGDSKGVRKKKREIQLFTSGHRDTQGQTAYTNQKYQAQHAHDRYNYRGQDYNKRHKDVTAASLERGGDRTKLSSAQDGEEGKDSNDEKDESSEVKEKPRQKKSQNYGPSRGSRLQNKGKVDESQRGSLIEQLTKGSYECMVCCETIRAQNAVWSCTNCYHVFHLRCIKKWARSPNSVMSGSERDGWRCPACQNMSFKFPNQYRCFCGKVRDPEVSRMETPHSCGDVCQKDRGEGCKHPCNILCHPGPCPECSAIVTKSCDCGKTKKTVKCGQSMMIKCDSVCERLLNCGRHFCRAKCHTGSCDKCEEVIKQECYGSHESREIMCGSEESFVESYSCTTICSKTLDCGNHTCDVPCHRDNCATCPFLPANVTHCPCGARPIVELGSKPRTSCLDPVPTCGAICNKPLLCGPQENRHRCKKPCHEGPCGSCSGVTIATCKCLFMEKEFKCSEIGQFTDETGSYICDKRCNRKKACGRHKCGQPCCVREEHPCDLLCGRKLSCGLHKCDEPCHKNNCPPCLMAGFDELACYCGAEVLFPPIPCGTNPPECHRPCTRDHGCSHPVRHNCHSEENCPPCTELTKKKCMGNHVLRSNIPCHLTDISCGMKCSRPLPCGEHSCTRTCHKDECLEEGQGCTQPCQRKRELCEHICGAPCHGEEPCPSSPCKAKVLVKCACGHREAPTQCSAGSSNMDSIDYQKITMQSLKDSLHGIMGTSSVNIGKFAPGRNGRTLECTEECALLERNRRVALALEIQNPDISAKLGSPGYSDFLKDQAKQNSQFVAGVEKALSDLVQSAKQSKQPSRSHPFASMNNNQRRIVHELAEFYGCETQSYDFEPKKNVVATAVRDRCWLPSLTLTSLVQRELHPRAPPPIPHFHKEESLRLTNQASKLSTSLFGEVSNTSTATTSSQPLAEGWQVIGKKTKKAATSSSTAGSMSAIGTIDKFEGNLADVCVSGIVDYASLSKESKEALKAEPVIDYFDFTVT